MGTDPTSPDGGLIDIRPIAPDEFDKMYPGCWPGHGTDREALGRLFASQGTLGMAAWDRDECVAQLHCYRVIAPDGRNRHWPPWTEWWWDHYRPEAMAHGPKLSGPVWCHSCFHVGRLLRSEGEGEIVPTTDERYFGRGIGTALCRASTQWAREHEYIAVLGPGAGAGQWEYAKWSGHLPRTSYARMGFVPVETPLGDVVDQASRFQSWASGSMPASVRDEATATFEAEGSLRNITDRWMVLQL